LSPHPSLTCRSNFLFEIKKKHFSPEVLDGWANASHSANNILVINTGAWWAASTRAGRALCADCDVENGDDVKRLRKQMRYAFEAGVNKVFDEIKDTPSTVIYRSLAPAHASCAMGGAAWRSLIRPYWFWREFETRNIIVKRIFAKINQYRRVKSNSSPPRRAK
jgi:hypothetical protein